MKTITLSLESLKKHADLLAKAIGELKHSEALETVSRVFYGYKDYHQAEKELKKEGMILYRTIKSGNQEFQLRMIPYCWVDDSFASLDQFWNSKPDLDNLGQCVEIKVGESWHNFDYDCLYGKRKDQIAAFGKIKLADFANTLVFNFDFLFSPATFSFYFEFMKQMKVEKQECYNEFFNTKKLLGSPLHDCLVVALDTNLDEEECDDEGMKSVCDHCGEYAGFSESPSGDSCIVCGAWVCGKCVDAVKMRELYEETGKECSTPLCTECAKDPKAIEVYLLRK